MSLHVVILEDEYMLRNVLRDVILAFDKQIHLEQFYNSDDAAAYIGDYGDTVDLYILDLRVPGERDGLELAKYIRTLNQSGVIVITSAYKSPDLMTLEALDCQWYPKPWHIMETTKHLLEIARLHRANENSGIG